MVTSYLSVLTTIPLLAVHGSWHGCLSPQCHSAALAPTCSKHQLELPRANAPESYTGPPKTLSLQGDVAPSTYWLITPDSSPLFLEELWLFFLPLWSSVYHLPSLPWLLHSFEQCKISVISPFKLKTVISLTYLSALSFVTMNFWRISVTLFLKTKVTSLDFPSVSYFQVWHL